ncbi:unnamed protein product [Caenorhabditis auriculariae]|uniref:Major facilitator superfamily (MFS) profile domain-containing protein n=1 Tax=Caenorhabditis auriculariae TaxID=2777116 RepID=A0A8S1H810_9PELO|nr:unnamed protein product [Caenorhabditis auriculariae]
MVTVILNPEVEVAGDKKPYTADGLLTSVGIWHPYPVFIVSSMAFLWVLSAMATMSPSYLAPATSNSNSSFITVQKEFEIERMIIDPGEMTSSVYFIGNLVFGQVYSTIADRVGRKPVIVFCLIFAGISGSLASVAPTFELLLLGRFFQGSFFTPLTMTNWVLCCESVAFAGHGYASVLFGVAWVLGYCIITPFAIFFPSWRYLQLATSLPTFIFGIVMFFTLPESISLLIQKKKSSEVLSWVHTASRLGKEKVEFDISRMLDDVQNEDEGKTLLETLRHVFATPPLVLYTTIETIFWIIDFMIYNGLSLSATGVSGSNAHLSYLFSGLVELPSYFLLPAALDWIGRKPTVLLSHVICAIALIAMFLFDRETDPQLFLIVWLTAKFAMACAFMCCFVYGAELFPTNCRNICLGVCATISNLGAMVSPHVPALDQIVYSGASFLFYAGCCVICSVLIFFLPETKDHGVEKPQQTKL